MLNLKVLWANSVACYLHTITEERLFVNRWLEKVQKCTYDRFVDTLHMTPHKLFGIIHIPTLKCLMEDIRSVLVLEHSYN